MAVSVPTKEPTTVRAGDTWEWTTSLADYPAGTYTLTYTFWNASAAFTATASASGSDHLVDIAPATTVGYASGRYEWVARASDGTDTYTVAAGVLQVLPAVGSSMDTRSHARKMLDAITATLESRATTDELDLVTASFNGRSMTRVELIKLRQHYLAAVNQEEQAAKLARGENTGRIFQVRFR